MKQSGNWYRLRRGRNDSLAIKAMVFDFDGTMLDTESAIFNSWQKIYETYDQSLPMDEWVSVVGKAALTFDPYERLQSLINKTIDVEEVEKSRREVQTEIIESMPLMPGIMSILEAAKSRGIKLAIASNSDIRWLATHLTRLGIINYFETICSRDQVVNVKPDPEIYLTAVKRLGVAPHEAIAFEDTPIGALAAVRAGLPTVVVPIELTRSLEFPSVSLTTSSLEDVPFDDLLALKPATDDVINRGS